MAKIMASNYGTQNHYKVDKISTSSINDHHHV